MFVIGINNIYNFFLSVINRMKGEEAYFDTKFIQNGNQIDIILEDKGNRYFGRCSKQIIDQFSQLLGFSQMKELYNFLISLLQQKIPKFAVFKPPKTINVLVGHFEKSNRPIFIPFNVVKQQINYQKRSNLSDQSRKIEILQNALNEHEIKIHNFEEKLLKLQQQNFKLKLKVVELQQRTTFQDIKLEQMWQYFQEQLAKQKETIDESNISISLQKRQKPQGQDNSQRPTNSKLKEFILQKSSDQIFK